MNKVFSPGEMSQYDRHMRLQEIGETGQQRLKQAKVLVVGAGGLGCPVLQYLAAAGIGTLGIVDDDLVDQSNLQRQILYNTTMLGKPKAEMAKAVLEKMNPFIQIVPYKLRLSNQNALEIIKKYDIVVDGTDNFGTRYMINDACEILEKPLVFASMYKFEGQVTVFHLNANSPTYRCLFPDRPSDDSIPNCSEIGVMGALPGIIGSIQASEVIKIVTGVGVPLNGKLLCYDNLNQEWQTIQFSKTINRRLSKETFINTSYDFELQCSLSVIKDITRTELLKNIDDYRLIDIREPHELPEFPYEKVEKIPLSGLQIKLLHISNEKPTVIICRSGVRSKRLIEKMVADNPDLEQLYNLKGGVLGFLSDADSY